MRVLIEPPSGHENSDYYDMLRYGLSVVGIPLTGGTIAANTLWCKLLL